MAEGDDVGRQLARTNWERAESRLAASDGPPIFARLAQTRIPEWPGRSDWPDCHGKGDAFAFGGGFSTEPRQIFDERGNPRFTDEPMRGPGGKPWVNSAGDAYAFEHGRMQMMSLYCPSRGDHQRHTEAPGRIADDCARLLRTLPPGVLRWLFSAPDLAGLGWPNPPDRHFWYATVFEIAMKGLQGVPGLATERLYRHRSTAVAVDAWESLRSLPAMRAQGGDTEILLKRRPATFFCDLDDMVAASRAAIDVLLFQWDRPADAAAHAAVPVPAPPANATEDRPDTAGGPTDPHAEWYDRLRDEVERAFSAEKSVADLFRRPPQATAQHRRCMEALRRLAPNADDLDSQPVVADGHGDHATLENYQAWQRFCDTHTPTGRADAGRALADFEAACAIVGEAQPTSESRVQSLRWADRTTLDRAVHSLNHLRIEVRRYMSKPHGAALYASIDDARKAVRAVADAMDGHPRSEVMDGMIEAARRKANAERAERGLSPWPPRDRSPGSSNNLSYFNPTDADWQIAWQHYRWPDRVKVFSMLLESFPALPGRLRKSLTGPLPEGLDLGIGDVEIDGYRPEPAKPAHRPREYDPDEDDRIVADWQRAKGAGVKRPSFCKDLRYRDPGSGEMRPMKVADLVAVQDRIRARKGKRRKDRQGQ